MREILFRGKTVKEEWVYGLLTHVGNAWYISNRAGSPLAYEVIPSTIGQYTGLTDKNGKRIFEGDILSYNKSKEVVYFDTSLRIPCFTTGIGWGSSTKEHPYKLSSRHVIIGNIHDNPKMLKSAAACPAEGV